MRGAHNVSAANWIVLLGLVEKDVNRDNLIEFRHQRAQQNTRQIIGFPPWLVHKLLAFGVLLYAGTGIYSLFMGYAYLDYAAIDPQHPSHGQHLGILIVEAGVGITVTGVMVAIYYAFAARAPILSDEDW